MKSKDIKNDKKKDVVKDNKKVISKKNVKEKSVKDKEVKKEKVKKKGLFQKIKLFFEKDKNNYTFLEVLTITLFSLIVGALACFSVMAIIFKGKNYFKLSKDLEKFMDAYEIITKNYYEDIDNDKLIDAAIEGMVSSVGDVYTNYADSAGAEEFDQYVNGEYEGIGCLILQYNDRVKILDVYDGTPASEAGLMVDDEIISVDDVMATDGAQSVSDYIKNTATGEMKLKIKRGEEELEFVLKRGKVEIPQVDSKIYEMNGKRIGYIGISMFTANVDSYFKKELNDLEKENIDSLIIDVRGNSGGYLSAVTNILNLFMEDGKPIYQVTKNSKTTERLKELWMLEHDKFPSTYYSDIMKLFNFNQSNEFNKKDIDELLGCGLIHQSDLNHHKKETKILKRVYNLK